MRQDSLRLLGKCVFLSVYVTHIRYEEEKETQVRDDDRELRHSPGPAGEHGNRKQSPERQRSLLRFEPFGHNIKSTIQTYA